jgi:hypothetical protein
MSKPMERARRQMKSWTKGSSEIRIKIHSRIKIKIDKTMAMTMTNSAHDRNRTPRVAASGRQGARFGWARGKQQKQSAIREEGTEEAKPRSKRKSARRKVNLDLDLDLD